VLLVVFSVAANSAGIDTSGSYNGKIKGVAIGHWGHVGVGFVDGVQCNGKNEAILLTSNPLYKEILSLLLAAETAKSDVILFRLSSKVQEFSASSSYCIVSSASLGDFTSW